MQVLGQENSQKLKWKVNDGHAHDVHTVVRRSLEENDACSLVSKDDYMQGGKKSQQTTKLQYLALIREKPWKDYKGYLP